MKKIIVILVILTVLIVANTLISKDYTYNIKEHSSLSKIIGLNTNQGKLFSDVKITIDGNSINIAKNDSCYEIQQIRYCADINKITVIEKFLTNEIIDIYEKNDKNLKRLGFELKEKSNSIIINNFKTLWLGNVNQYDETYVLYIDKIYKVNFYKVLSNVSTKEWIDKSKPIFHYSDHDEFNILFDFVLDIGPTCVLKHDSLILNLELSNIRNTFIDLYAEDIILGNKSSQNRNLGKVIGLVEKGTDIHDIKYVFTIIKEGHLVYLRILNDMKVDYTFVVPNSVYDNLNFDCKKIGSNLRNQ